MRSMMAKGEDEGPAALLPGWNINFFHYWTQSADSGHPLVSLQVHKADNKAFKTFLDTVGYLHVEETSKPAYQLFSRI